VISRAGDSDVLAQIVHRRSGGKQARTCSCSSVCVAIHLGNWLFPRDALLFVHGVANVVRSRTSGKRW
jgi:hypothetical protein